MTIRTGIYIVAYDITNNRERARVDKILKGFGFRRQKSVFECRLTEIDKKKLLARLEKIDLKTGFVKIYKQEHSFQSRVIGVEKNKNPDEGYAFIY